MRIKYKYLTNKFPFKETIERILGEPSLDDISFRSELFKRENDQSTHLHSKFYDFARTDEFQNLYTEFIYDIKKRHYNGDRIVYQKIPTFRVCLKDNIAVGEFHRDRDYRDLNWATTVREHNIFLPFTDAFDTNTIWVESQEGLEDYAPMNCSYGEYYLWDGSNLKHGNMVNTTGKTRVSVDFRIVPFERFVDSDKGSINTNTKFKIGGYYEVV